LRTLRIGVAGLGRAFSVMLPTFVRDPRLGIDRPSEMRTSWPGRGAGITIPGVATYGTCRRFGVETSETILPPR